MERIDRKIYNSEKLLVINSEIIDWNLEKRHGMQKWRAHDRYGFIELNLYELENYKNKINKGFPSDYCSNIDWKVDENIFPKELYHLHLEEIKDYADFIASYISALKGKHLNFIFEITFAGFHIIDSFRKNTYGRALIEAVISCFNQESYNAGKSYKEKYHSPEKIEYQMSHYKND
ncbi:hypothetical protein SAMN05421866_1024 [Chryseobacterium oranimense]|uniref:Uncharacterized protein n=1 Tax=Chryseobacterium oranimense TaxID=421058 RepID=A0A1M5LCW0_9FLAO|nr:hypothetical protein [Chryseobacterium oranimense]SHG62233.1 hypothetical protein SAMN05421866_1024 [Chryseobacterium oranimense]